jgi:hypothetical protein
MHDIPNETFPEASVSNYAHNKKLTHLLTRPLFFTKSVVKLKISDDQPLNPKTSLASVKAFQPSK